MLKSPKFRDTLYNKKALMRVNSERKEDTEGEGEEITGKVNEETMITLTRAGEDEEEVRIAVGRVGV